MRYIQDRWLENYQMLRFPCVGQYNIPVISPEPFVDVEWVSYNCARTSTNRAAKGVHFFIDDYQFERVWRDFKREGKLLREFGACMTPEFSMYTDFPKAMQIYNHYRRHFIGAYLQHEGVKVIPSLCWSDEKSLDWCFDGEPVGSCVAISSVGTQRHLESRRLFKYGYDAMCERLKPETIIFYGEVPKECRGNIVRIRAFQEKFRKAKISDYT